MTQEEKIKEAKRLYKTANADQRYVLETLFPELAESEDEKIRKELIDIVAKSPITFAFKDKGKVLAWLEKQYADPIKEYWRGYNEGKQNVLDKYAELEKQDEQNPIMNVPAREVILSIWNLGNEWKELTGGSISTKYDTQLKYIQKHWQESEYYLRAKQGEQKPAWSEEDEEKFSFIRAILIDAKSTNNCASNSTYYREVTESIEWLKSLKDRVQPQPKQEWKQENTDDLNDFENVMMHIGGSFFGENAGLDPNDTNAIKEQANLLLELVPKLEWSEEDEEMWLSAIEYVRTYPAHTNSVVDWLKSLRDRYTWKPKHEWSEEDEQYLLVCKNALAKYQTTDKWDANVIYRWLENKLKSLRPQNRWKPSDEQLDALHDAAVYVDKSMFPHPKGILMKLYDQLKKLRGE